jgi:hypothetical protein
MPSLRRRVLNVLMAKLLEIPGIGKVSIDLRGYLQLMGDDFPAAFVVARSDAEPAEGQPFGQQRLTMPFMIMCYVKAEGGGTEPDGVSALREDFLQQVENVLMSDETVTAMQTAGEQHGNGAAVLGPYHDGYGQMDEGQTPPFGYVEWLGSVILHYARGQL